ncbi:hypothetical protein [Roseitranquillus sediminis]|uniref:hypothetical protein n=1 Tax=Roseitranquillus sediminis TaxID=2809051 RepID=UPI001D0CA29B|nr:hypothetical protein [Roseitranquillus sediminis]MBM9595685.1 hypothetical protein [Roseitranquillus sediminis]
MKAPREPLFLARRGYRRRRIMDAARILPYFGLFLFMLPVLRGGHASSIAVSAIYLFGVWFGLILAAFVLSGRLKRIDPEDDG